MTTWYYVDAGGNTQGPLNLQQMKGAFQQGKLKEQSFVWNGADVNQWTPMNKVPSLLKQVKPQNIPAPKSKSPPIKKSGRKPGRSALLAGIRRGTKLRKAPKPVEKQVGQPAPKRPGQPMTLQEQMAATLRRRRMGGSKKTGGPKKTPVKKNTFNSPKRNFSNNNTSAPKKNTYNAPKNTYNAPKKTLTWREKQELKKKEELEKKKQQQQHKSNGSVSNVGSNSRIENIKKKLNGAQDWQLKAIEKLLS